MSALESRLLGGAASCRAAISDTSFGRRRNHRVQGDSAAREVAHGLHQIQRDTVGLPLRDSARGLAEVVRERGRAPFLSFQPFGEVHVRSLEHPKPFGQGLPKPALFSIGLMENRRRDRFIAYFNGPPLKGDRELLIRKTGYTKGRVSQFFDRDQPFGERAARALAERLGLDADYFEREMGTVPKVAYRDLNGFEAQLVELFRKLSPEEQHEHLIQFNEHVNRKAHPDAPASPADPFKNRRVASIGHIPERRAAPPGELVDSPLTHHGRRKDGRKEGAA